MRFDIFTHTAVAFPSKRFVWGYILHECRWYPYFRLVLPSLAWEYRLMTDDHGWCWRTIFWRRCYGFRYGYLPVEYFQ